MNEAQDFLTTEDLADLVITKHRELDNIYVSDVMMNFLSLRKCKDCCYFQEHSQSLNRVRDGRCSHRSLFITECDFDFGCNRFKKTSECIERWKQRKRDERTRMVK